jgi:hypothetical protein
MKKDAELIQAVRDAGYRRLENSVPPGKPAPAEKPIHIPLAFEDVISAVLKVKPQPKAPVDSKSKKRAAKKPH